MSLFLKLFQWMLVGLTAVLLYLPFRYDAYLQIILLFSSISIIVPGIEKMPVIRMSILHSVKLRLTLWLCLVLTAIFTFLSIPHATSEDRIQQGIVQLQIHDIIREQQSNYLEQGEFLVFLKEPKNLSLDNQYYHFNFEVQNSAPRNVKITATASSKHPLKSYTGAIFEPKSDAKGIFVQVICETRKPSQVPPDMPVSPKSKSDNVTCPFGSNDVTQEMAKFNKPSPDLQHPHNKPTLEDPQIAFP
ncbi:MAG: hypothetical protein HC860_07820 [Alkalinema sp. RU_4_3]|nr:hypothetical protein [Alkalinema sp. RU_4_3]